MNTTDFEKIYNEISRLKGTTERMDLSRLDAQLSVDPKLRNLLNTPAKFLPENYKYLVNEIYEDDEEKTPYYGIKESCNRLKSTTFFPTAGGKIVGFFAYIIGEGNKIDEIKMFSFDLERSNPVLAADLIRLLDRLSETYVEIKWKALKKNPACEQYNRIIKRFNGTVTDVSDTTYQYSIPGKNIKTFEVANDISRA